jgi:hypothetical protein
VKTWTAWETTRRQVALAGRVVGAGGRPLSGADVALTEMPEAFRRRLAGGAAGRRLAEADGIYYFLDLPTGRYTVRCADGRTGTEAAQTVSVAWSNDGTVTMVVADLELPAAGAQ